MPEIRIVQLVALQVGEGAHQDPSVRLALGARADPLKGQIQRDRSLHLVATQVAARVVGAGLGEAWVVQDQDRQVAAGAADGLEQTLAALGGLPPNGIGLEDAARRVEDRLEEDEGGDVADGQLVLDTVAVEVDPGPGALGRLDATAVPTVSA